MTHLIKQLTGSDCVLASIAMAADKRFHSDLWTTEDIDKVLASKGIGDEAPWMLRAGFEEHKDYVRRGVRQTDASVVQFMLWRRRALLSVCSLNIDGGFHMVYWDGETVFDPSTQRTFQFLHSMKINEVLLFNERKHGDSNEV